MSILASGPPTLTCRLFTVAEVDDLERRQRCKHGEVELEFLLLAKVQADDEARVIDGDPFELSKGYINSPVPSDLLVDPGRQQQLLLCLR